ncbi:lipid-A-disaccharide synthase [Alphaproteobacteria bacterium]|nr:lipid-A-disaccharide synthase [Alphaproteobacteria bacterium]
MTLNINKKFFILAGETSSDYIGSSIINGLINKEGPNTSFFGIGGPLMKEAGLKTIYEMNNFNILGFVNVIYNYKKLNNYKNNIIKHILIEKPDAVITIDTKGFSLALAKKLKILFIKNNFKCPLIHFVPPTIWAYGKSRIKKWKNLHDGLFCLFKNEVNIFNQYNIKCDYVGNPVIENFINNNEKKVNSKKFYKKHNINEQNLICLLFPGSRDTEINNILPEFILLIKNNQNTFKFINWIIPTTKLQYSKIIKWIRNAGISKIVKVIILKDNYEILKCADIAVACSGTITLELVLFKIPTIAVYKTDFLSSFIGRMLVDFKNVLLPNFILERMLVPFLFQEKCQFKHINDLLFENIEKIETKKKLFEHASNEIIERMNYGKDNINSYFSTKSSDKIMSIINNFN